MKIENPQLKLGLHQIASGAVTLLNAFLLEIAEAPLATGSETVPPSTPAPDAPKKGGRPKKAAVEPVAETPVPPATSEPAASATIADAPKVVTFDMIRSAVSAYCAVPGASMDKAKAIVLGFGVEKIGQLTDEQRPQVLAAIEKAAADLKNGDDIFTS